MYDYLLTKAGKKLYKDDIILFLAEKKRLIKQIKSSPVFTKQMQENNLEPYYKILDELSLRTVDGQKLDDDEVKEFLKKLLYNEKFGQSTRKRLPIILCCDINNSMLQNINLLNAFECAVFDFLKTDVLFSNAVDISILSFGDKVKIEKPFCTVNKQTIPQMSVCENAGTSLGDCISVAIELLNQRKAAYRDRGIRYFKPRLIIASNGNLIGTNEIRTINTSLKKLNQLENDEKIYVYNFAIGQNCNSEILQKLSIKNDFPILISCYKDLGLTDFYKIFNMSALVAS